jgi:hypothetical protein
MHGGGCHVMKMGVRLPRIRTGDAGGLQVGEAAVHSRAGPATTQPTARMSERPRDGSQQDRQQACVQRKEPPAVARLRRSCRCQRPTGENPWAAPQLRSRSSSAPRSSADPRWARCPYRCNRWVATTAVAATGIAARGPAGPQGVRRHCPSSRSAGSSGPAPEGRRGAHRHCLCSPGTAPPSSRSGRLQPAPLPRAPPQGCSGSSGG